ncbi:hypothetical protein [Nitrosomonas aestuarii]|uniref:hypothetical protein n=1 Tax=Nitrosomonas aestuarii TaxID=52441 RepID=UPI0015E7D5C0|nr:hypothetical protein [Nitrosomonas aestuarii]
MMEGKAILERPNMHNTVSHQMSDQGMELLMPIESFRRKAPGQTGGCINIRYNR